MTDQSTKCIVISKHIAWHKHGLASYMQTFHVHQLHLTHPQETMHEKPMTSGQQSNRQLVVQER